MQNIKSLQASLLSKTFQYQQKFFFVTSTLWGFYLDSGKAILEQTLWAVIAKNLGENSLLDEGMNKDVSEFIVYGDAFAPLQLPVPRVDVSVSLAEISKTLNIYGERHWQGVGPLLHASKAEPFTQQSLSYDFAYGGVDHLYNKNGKGLSENEPVHVLQFLANIEQPSSPILAKNLSQHSHAYIPQGFSALPFEWPQRKSLIGTYDDDYLQNHMSGLAEDVNWDYFFTAPADQRFNRYLNGDEDFTINNMHATMAEIKGRLPSVLGRCFIEQEVSLNSLEQDVLESYSDAEKSEDKLLVFKEIPLNLDTVYFFPNDNVGIVVHRGSVEICHPQGKDVKKILIAHQGLTESFKPKEFYKQQMSLRCDPEEGFKYMMYSAPLIPVDTTCGFKQLLGDAEYEESMGNNMIAFAERQKKQAEQKVDEAIDQQVGELKANGMDKEAQELLQKFKTPPKNIELPEDAKKLQAIADKILPGISSMQQPPKLDEIDLTQINLKALDDLQEQMLVMAEKQKKEALLQTEQQLVELKKQAVQQPEMAIQLAAPIQKIEQMLGSMDDIPILVRPDTIELDAQLTAQFNQATGQLAEQQKLIVEHNIQLSDQQQQQINELEQQLYNKNIFTKIKEANDFINDSYLKGAHFIGETRSPHKGREPELMAALIASYFAKQVITDKDLAFCILTQQAFNGINLSNSYFEHSELVKVNFDQADLSGINFAHARLRQVKFNNCLMAGANLGAATITDCQFLNIKLIDVTLAKSSVYDCEFTDCDFGDRMDMLIETKLYKCKFTNCTFPKLDFIELDLTACEFIDCDLSECNFVKTILINASFKGSVLNGTNFVTAQLNNSSFENAYMKNTRFVGGCLLNNSRFNRATINETNLRDCQLNQCDFSDADICKSDFGESSIKNAKFNRSIAKQTQFIDSILSGSEFKKADCMEANLMQADIRTCDFSGANLYGVSFLNAILGNTSFSDAILDNTLLKDWRP